MKNLLTVAEKCNKNTDDETISILSILCDVNTLGGIRMDFKAEGPENVVNIKVIGVGGAQQRC